MFANDAATIIGIRPTALRKYLRNHGIDTARGKHARYEFSMEEVLELKAKYWKTAGTQLGPEGDDGDPGLPIGALSDPSQRQAFRELRRARDERLYAQMHNAGMTLPQMDNETLARMGRIL